MLRRTLSRQAKSAMGGTTYRLTVLIAPLLPARLSMGGGQDQSRADSNVRLTLPSGRQPQIDGFETEAEARDWIKARSTAWLKMYESGRYP
jgi:hypothetical protein